MDWRCVATVAAVTMSVVAIEIGGASGESTRNPVTLAPYGRAGVAQNVSPTRIADLPFARLKPDTVLAIELEPGAISTADALWVMQHASASIVRIDAKNNTSDKPIPVGKPPCGSLVVGFDAVWVPSCAAGTLTRVDLAHRNISASMPMPLSEPRGTIATAARSVWLITDAKGVVSRIDPATTTPVAEVYVAAKPFALAADGDVLWATSEDGDTLTRIDGHTNVIVQAVKVGPRPGPVAVGEGAVWTLNRGDGSISRVDPSTNKVVTTIKVDMSVSDGTLAVGEGAVWISAPGVPLVRIDARTNRVTHKFTGPGGGAVVVAHGSVWVNAGPNLTWRVDPRLVAALRPS